MNTSNVRETAYLLGVRLATLRAQLCMVAKMLAIEEEKGEPGAGRYAANSALEAVIDFLDSIPGFKNEGLVRPVEKLSKALLRSLEGHRSQMLEPIKHGHRPPDDTFTLSLKGHAAAAMTLFMRAGDTLEEAGATVASALERAGYRLPGGHIPTWRTIKVWRDKVIGRADAGHDVDAYDSVIEEFDQSNRDASSFAEVILIACCRIFVEPSEELRR